MHHYIVYAYDVAAAAAEEFRKIGLIKGAIKSEWLLVTCPRAHLLAPKRLWRQFQLAGNNILHAGT